MDMLKNKIQGGLWLGLSLLALWPVLAYEAGQDVLVQKSDGNWYRGWILRSEAGRHLVALNESANHLVWVADEQLQPNTRAPLPPEKKQITGWQNGEGSLREMALSLNGDWLAVASEAGWVQVFEQDTLFPLTRLPAKGVVSLAFHPQSSVLAMCGQSGLQFYRTADWSLQAQTALPARCEKVSYSSQGLMAVVGETVGKFSQSSLWLVSQLPFAQAPQLSFSAGQQRISALQFSPDGRFLALGYAGQKRGVAIFQLQELKRGPQIVWKTPGDILALAFSPDGNLIAGGGTDKHLYLWERGGKIRWKTRLGTDTEQALTALGFAPDGKSLAACGRGKWKGVKRFDLKTGQLVQEWGHYTTTHCSGVAFNQKGTALFQSRHSFSNLNETLLDRYPL